MGKIWKPSVNPTPGVIRLQSKILEPKVQEHPDGGWTFESMAQYYEVVNDWLFYFHKGSGRKTIRERVKSGRVKIHDGHPFDKSVSATLGKVLSAKDTPEGATYVGYISSTEPKVAQKIDEGVIDENSLEVVFITTKPLEVEIDAIPVQSRDYVQIAKSGKAIVTGIKEWMWRAIGLVSSSSQGVQAIFTPPTIVADVDLAVSSAMGWGDPIAARLATWAGGAAPKLRRGHLAQWFTDGGEEVFCGQIATLDEAGQLVVSRSALVPALEELEARIEDSGLGAEAREATLRAADSLVAGYLRRCRGPICPAADDVLAPEDSTAEELTASAEGVTHSTEAAPQGVESEQAATEEPTGTEAASAAETSETAEPETAAEPATTPLTAGEDATKAVAQLQLRVYESRIFALWHRLGVANVPAIDGGGLPAAGRSGPDGSPEPGHRAQSGASRGQAEPRGV